MSSGSYFVILRKSKENRKFSDKFLDEYIITKYNQYNDFNFKNKKVSSTIDEMKKEIPNYFQLSTFKFLSIEDKNEYDIVMQAHFISTFDVLKDEFNLNPYNKFSIREISLEICKEMKIAIDYILSFEYSKKYELILDNYYIDLFGNMLPFFQYRFNKKLNQYFKEQTEQIEIKKESLFLKILKMLFQKNKNIIDIINEEDNFFQEEQEAVYFLKKIKTILNTFILLNDENTLNEAEYILLYQIY